ncbi:DUF3888 domain-containing protein [Clostridium sp. LS]|uniref:DUF3888 domain-containing protein n=1 Tax=Clostridium sp. LS TaxID=1352601 RepID=UPI00031B36E9|nr:DUF3888 domain-containing protein [Clostridium sp. LS]
MKKIVFVVSILTVAIFFIFPYHAYATIIKQQSQMADESKEIIYRDVVLSLFVPCMQEEINNYYKKYLIESPTIAPYSVDIVNVKRLSGYRIQFEVIAHPYVGLHITVGDDRMIVETAADGSIEIKNFEHIESYSLPWNWKHIIKK